MDELNQRFPRYRQLLRLYPASYRAEYGGQMLQTLADMLDDAPTAGARAGVWARAIVDVPISALNQQLILAGGIIMHDTPSYIKRNAIISAILLTPFFVFIGLDSITSHSIYGSWAWKPAVLWIWLVSLPALASGLSSATFMYWQHQRKTSFWKSLFDWRHNWPMLGAAAIGLGIVALAFGHDSVHCVAHNPIPEIRYWHTTWTCLRNG